jgi:uncharacterized protein (DUF2336 family)
MSKALPIIDELEKALKSGSTEKHLTILQNITDLFLAGRDKITEEVASVFDDVVIRLIDHVERRALVELGAQFAPIANAPPNVIRRLASDDDIKVAGPVLAQSVRLTDQDLVVIAGSKGQSHLSKIAERAQINPVVTAVLVDRGDHGVVNKVATNSGAKFSKTSMSMLVLRASGDDDLTHAVGRRVDIPPTLFNQLLTHATEQARQRLLASAQPGTRDAINRVLTQIADQASGKAMSQKEYNAVERLAHSFREDTALTKSKMREFAVGNRIQELTAALTVLCAVPIALVGRLINDTEPFGAMVLCKAIRLDWLIAQAVLIALPGAGTSRAAQIEQMCEDYDRLSTPSAHHLLGYWQARQARQKLP